MRRRSPTPPRDIEVTGESAVATIAHELVTEDRSSCGPGRAALRRPLELVATAEGWRAASLTAEKLAGLEPADACGRVKMRRVPPEDTPAG